MSGFNTVDTTGFDAAIQAFRTAKTSYDGAWKTLVSTSNNLKACWLGAGGTRFARISKDIMRMLKDDGDSLTCIADNLERIREQYKDVDRGIGKEIRKFDMKGN